MEPGSPCIKAHERSCVLPRRPSAGPELGAHSHPHKHRVQPGLPCHAMPMLCHAILTEPHTGRDGDEGHDATEAAIDGEQRLVEVAGGRVRVVLVEEGEGGGGEGVEGSRGQQHGQVPALVLRGARQPAGQWVRGSSGPTPTQRPALTSSYSRCAQRR